jgi:hypothetical protein
VKLLRPVKEKPKKHKPFVLSDHHDAGGSDSDGDQFAAAQVYFPSYVVSSTKLRFAFECCFVVFTSPRPLFCKPVL